MTDPTRARGHKWQFVEGMFCLTVHGEDPRTSVAIPIGALLTLAADGRRRQMALHRQAVSPDDSGESESTPVLILDRGLETELLLGLSPEIAETLADLFIKNAGGASRD
jgi:hypothetical protein